MEDYIIFYDNIKEGQYQMNSTLSASNNYDAENKMHQLEEGEEITYVISKREFDEKKSEGLTFTGDSWYEETREVLKEKQNNSSP